MIRNISKKKTLSNRTKYANSLHSKAIGLMFKDKIDYGLVFNFNIENIRHFHTMFMRFPIDVLFLDSDKKVTKICRKVKPWKLDINGKAKYVVELSAGKSSNTEKGDKISFK